MLDFPFMYIFIRDCDRIIIDNPLYFKTSMGSRTSSIINWRTR